MKLTVEFISARDNFFECWAFVSENTRVRTSIPSDHFDEIPREGDRFIWDREKKKAIKIPFDIVAMKALRESIHKLQEEFAETGPIDNAQIQ